MTVRELERRMDSHELSEWLAYDQLDVIPDLYWIGAQICWVIASTMSSGKRRYTIADFIPRARPSPRILSGDVAYAIWQGIKAAQNEKLKRGHHRMG